MAGVRFVDVSHRFGDVDALIGLSLAIEPGEFVSFLGPSGSGKTTSLNLLAGLLTCQRGEIYIGKRLVNSLPPDQRNLAMVFQNYALYPHMTVAENLAFPLRARRGLSSEHIRKRVAEVAETLGLSTLLERLPKELSGGQQQRVALGRALIRNPEIFLLDEPLSNLDARLRIRMRRDLKKLHEQLRSTIVYVTHDQAEAMTLSSRIAVFNHGRMQQFGTPEEIYARPVNMFVANFLGEREMTFIKGEVAAEDGQAVFRAKDFALPLGDRPNVRAGKAALGLRVESLVAVPGEQSAPLRAEVTLTELSGPDLILYVRDLRSSQELMCRADAHAVIHKGDCIGLRPIPDRLYLFDSDSEAALLG